MPTLVPRSRAIGVSRLAGKNSDVTNPKTPNDNDMTAGHAIAVRVAVGMSVSPDGRLMNIAPKRYSNTASGYFL
jgi:hypothetical protein